MPSAATGAGQKPIHLHYTQGDRPVLITRQDEDRLVMTVAQAAAACQAAAEQAEFGLQYRRDLMERLTRWLAEHDSRVRKAYLSTREGGLLFMIVRSDVPYDARFEDEVTDLLLSVAADPALRLIDLDVIALPNTNDESAEAFAGPDRILVVFQRGK